MSFEFTASEHKRIMLAKLAGIQLDYIGHADLAVIIILSIVYLTDFLAVAFILWHKSYAPLKSKYPILMSSCILAMFIWFLGDLVLKSHIHVKGVFSNCMVFCVWMRVLFGTFLVSALISVRSYALFCVFRRNRAYKGKYVWYSGGLVVVVGLVFLLVTYVMPEENTVHYIPLVQMCNMSYAYRAIVQGLLWATWIVNAVINYRLRNITSSFNESREMGVACISVFVLLTFNTVILYTYPLYPTRTALRVSETLLSHSIANFLWWFIMFRSIYNCATRRTEYLAEWKQKLFSDGLQKQYRITRTDPFSGTMLSIGSNAKGVTLPRNMQQGYEMRMSFSRKSVNHQQESPTEGSEEAVTRTWYSNNCGASILSSEGRAEEEDDNSNIMLFSPQRVNGRPLNNLENISSATTIHESHGTSANSAAVVASSVSASAAASALSGYHFLAGRNSNSNRSRDSKPERAASPQQAPSRSSSE
ncbi:hypothetical protein J3B02_000825 [Coemansia erecta]|uniref:Uncharacterized protein n=1 Tax=Coemansia asiatica TaxID=1052880 RepID=A0A9W8CK23_9FUNG|nr:hypothetical protein LPJ64_003391 [Coemansia asiatica]KAJ2857697.1 hypothetical protein J3B02_000825 [Coemansia erecta]KAJ2888323.1 hypothetical protein FB639_000716 [Coemansia asiatica]